VGTPIPFHGHRRPSAFFNDLLVRISHSTSTLVLRINNVHRPLLWGDHKAKFGIHEDTHKGSQEQHSMFRHDHYLFASNLELFWRVLKL
jgi:hypothetical protein